LITRLTVSIRTTAGPTLSTAFTMKLLPCWSEAWGGASLIGTFWAAERWPGREGRPGRVIVVHPTRSDPSTTGPSKDPARGRNRGRR
jgi:hypothetical protein